jgi:hypothetical protein
MSEPAPEVPYAEEDAFEPDDDERDHALVEAAIGDARQPEGRIISIFDRLSAPVVHGISAAGAYQRPKKILRVDPGMPEPEVRAIVVDAADKRVGSSPRAMAKQAEALGWKVRISYARRRAVCPKCGALERYKANGNLYAHGPKGDQCDDVEPIEGSEDVKVVDSILVVCTRDGRLIAGSWVDGKIEGAQVWARGYGLKKFKIGEARAQLDFPA